MISVPWEALLPLLIDSAARGDSDAREELERLARAMDGWNQRAPSILAALEGGRTREAIALLRGGMK